MRLVLCSLVFLAGHETKSRDQPAHASRGSGDKTKASKQADIHTHVRNAVTLVWGSLRLAPINICSNTETLVSAFNWLSKGATQLYMYNITNLPLSNVLVAFLLPLITTINTTTIITAAMQRIPTTLNTPARRGPDESGAVVASGPMSVLTKL